MTKLTQRELKDWLELIKMFRKQGNLDGWTRTQLLHLNHKVIEICHDIHNESMVGSLKSY